MAVVEKAEKISLWRLPFSRDLLGLSIVSAVLIGLYIFGANLAGAGPKYLLIVVPLGVFYWTFLEYVLHRWVFHWEPTRPAMKRLRSVFPPHRAHHTHPDRARGAAMLDWRYVAILSPLYTAALCVTPLSAQYALALNAGLLIGYFAYEFVHAACHRSPMRGPFLTQVRRFHAIHDLRDETVNFGVTSTIWDYVFGTHYLQQRRRETMAAFAAR